MLNKLTSKLLVNVQTATANLSKSAAALAPASHQAKVEVAVGAFAAFTVAMTVDALAAGPTQSRKKITNLVASVSSFILIIVAFAVVLMSAVGAFLFITAGGNHNRVSQAKQTVKNVFIGLAVAAAIYLLRSVVLDILGGVDPKGGELRDQLDNGGLKGKN